MGEPAAPASEPGVPADGPAAVHSGFLRRFIRLAGPFFASEDKWKVRLLAGGVIALALVQIAVQIRLNLWNKDFFNALEAKDWDAFLGTMGMFAFLASASMGIAVYQVYLKQLLQLRWREWLTNRLVDSWLEGGRHYQMGFVGGGVENPDQRIAENAHWATDMAVEFSLGVLSAVLTLVSFLGILWTLSGILHVVIAGKTFDIPGYMVAAALFYAAVGTTVTYFVGRPIVTANINQNTAEADYRFALVRLRENSEGIALIRGEGDERTGLRNFFSSVMAATLYLMRTQRRLMWLTSAYGMVGMVYPTLVASPRYFSGVITLGGLMQIGAAFGQVQSGLNWFVDNFPRLAEWRSHVERVLEFEQAVGHPEETAAALESGEKTNIGLVEAAADADDEILSFDNLQIAHSDGSIVIGDTTTTIKKGEKVLIVGESGSGKSTLFRAIAGLWPWGAGTITLPSRDKIMFMPQRPYLPLGTLRCALAYPAAADHFPEADMLATLERCGLGHLAPRLDDAERWDRVLSGGELQRVAFARLLLHKPGWVFMDEATAALDEDGQTSLMGMFADELAGSTLISIAHRPGLDAFHDRTLLLVKSETGAKLVRQPQPAKRRHGMTKRLLRSLVPSTLKASTTSRVRNAAHIPEGAIDRFRIDGALSQKRRQTRPSKMIEDAGTAARRLSAETVATRRTPSSSEVFIIGVIVVAVLYLARDVFIPLALATLLAFALAPTVLMLRRWHFNRILSVVCVVVLAFIVIVGVGTIMGGQLAQLAENLPGYQTNIINKIHDVRGTGGGSGTIQRTTAMIQKLGDEIAKSDTPGSAALKPGGSPTQAPIPVQIREPEPTPFAIVETTVGPLLQPLATTGIVIIFVIFVLLQREDLRDRFIRLAGRGDLHRTTDALDEAAQRISRYLLAQAAINTCFGLLIGTGLWLIGAPNPVLCGIVAMLLRFVPYVGPIIAAALPAALTLAVDPGWSMLFWAMGLFLTAELITGQIVEPWLYGHNTGLSTIAVVVAAAFWTWLWGPVGLLLSTPLTVCLVVLGRHVEHLQFLDVLLGDQPALAPEESFYQRMLADDPDEAAHQAEEMLKTVPLATYYDEVAIKGLALAQIDVNRGTLDHECRARIKGAVDGLLDDLSDHADPEAPPAKETAATEPGETDAAAAPVFAPDDLPAGWRKTPVMCIAGRGSLDEAAAAMLAQLLGASGIAASVVATGVVSAGNLFRLDGDGVQVACLSYLEPGGYTSARFLVRRLRRKLPRATILVGFWSLPEAEAEAAKQATGADRVVTSLRGALVQVVEAATAAAGSAPTAPASEIAEQPAAG